MMHIVIALGGNALLQRGQPLEASILQQNVKLAAQTLAPIATNQKITIVHGNGPQVGLLALQSEAYKEVEPYPFDLLDAETQGQIGYLLQQALSNALRKPSVITLLTQVIVNQDDPAFLEPTKFIGPIYTEEQVNNIKQTKAWTFKLDGSFLRRVVPSPKPQDVHELRAIQELTSAGYITIVGGGGGIPCIKNHLGHLQGIEAVIDKDLTASLIARKLQVDALMILTDIDAVYENWGSENATPIRNVSWQDLETLTFANGSMQPKVLAACEFVKHTGKIAMIGQLSKASEILAGDSGTLVT